MTDPTPAAAPVCYRHPDRETWIRCQRCDRPICPDCMNSAAVGFQCPSCIKEGAKETRQGRLPYGGNRTGNPALTTFVLIGLNLAVFVLIRASAASDYLGEKLSLLPQTTTFATASGPLQIDGVSGGDYWKIVTSGFAHQEFMHIALNMIALYFLGPQLESILGRTRFLAVYLISLLTGGAAVMLLSSPHGLTLGASGAIFGLLGALVVTAVKIKADLQPILVWVGINVVYSFVASNISWQGHLGGFVGGLAVAGVLLYAPKPNRTTVQAVGLAAITLLSCALIVVRATALA